MSNSDMLGTYNSRPDALRLTISTMDEKTGKFTGTFVAPNGDNLNISGGFNFNSEKKRTDLSFKISTAEWAFYANYDRDNKKWFEEWIGDEYKDGAVTGHWTFYKDLSGPSSGTNFGYATIADKLQ
ncbi:hypothetical protein [Pseudomonas fluorescens]|uniref:Uncharacterized protein n=1 Tax=Pseudomonas fluorescens TaxID=294 RepID=A0A423N896_PSEFL|nr:hypothetical protein [Pseudomonas fluorescens]RON94359.1 hypothetical protein BK672_18970 [Pseudomonas fluorescens]